MTIPDTKTRRVRAALDLLTRSECTARDLTRRLGLPDHKLRSVQRDLEELMQTGEIERLSGGKYRRPIRTVPLNPVEALAVYSAARMLYHHAGEYNEHYLSALEKLTAQLPAPARRVALQANEAYRNKPNAGTSRTFELVAQAWLNGRVLKCNYHSPHKVTPLEVIIYFIEVNARNREGYAIGVNRLREGGKPFVYRLSRMRDVTLLSDTCDIPDDFHPLQFLSGAWGIMTGDPVRVELFFDPEVRERVAETPLGDGAELKVLASGHSRVVLTVGGWKELLPWILGWGGHVEVLAPDELRQAVAEAHHRGAALYP